MRQIKIVNSDNISYISGFINEPNSDQFLAYFDMILEESEMNSLRSWLKAQPISEYAIIKHILVSDESKGKGMGKNLLKSFVALANCPILLVCDHLEPQRPNFDLEQWYVSQGFVYTGISSRSGPVLVLYR